jgi:hypothetical protein
MRDDGFIKILVIGLFLFFFIRACSRPHFGENQSNMLRRIQLERGYDDPGRPHP